MNKKVVFNSDSSDPGREGNKENNNSRRLPERDYESNLSVEAQVLLEKYLLKLETHRASPTEANIKVSEVLGSVAFLYERFRNAIDYKGEHLLRRNAIERIIRRQIWERPGKDVNKISSSLVKELIWARYIKNDSIPKRKLNDIAQIITKHLNISELIGNFATKELGAKLNDVKEWFLGIASAEIEEILDPEVFYIDALNASVFSWFKKNFEWQDKNLTESEKDTQILIAAHRSLTKSDKVRVRYHLLKMYYPDWEELTREKIIEKIAGLLEARKLIEMQIDSLVQPRIYRFVQKQSAAFAILREIIEKDIKEAKNILESPPKLESIIKKVCQAKYKEITRRVNRGILRSIIYIFSTKVLLALVVEVPFELIFWESINYLALGINMFFPPFLMFLVGISIKKPNKENTQRIVDKIKSFVYQKNEEGKFKFTLAASKKNNFLYKAFFLVYTALSFLVFTGITFVLIELNFNIISGVVFFMFLSLVLLFGYRVRYTASEFSVTGEKEGIVSHLFTNLTLPFLNLGIWLSEGLAKFNFLIIIMDFLIEVPFKRIIGVFEEWTSFIKEKKEEAVEVPG